MGLTKVLVPFEGTSSNHPLCGWYLIILAWALEYADPELAITAVHNWLGLAPEERWWLYTMTNVATGHAINERNKGWRKALRFAFTENPAMEGVLRHRRSEFELSLLSGQ